MDFKNVKKTNDVVIVYFFYNLIGCFVEDLFCDLSILDVVKNNALLDGCYLLPWFTASMNNYVLLHIIFRPVYYDKESDHVCVLDLNFVLETCLSMT